MNRRQCLKAVLAAPIAGTLAATELIDVNQIFAPTPGAAVKTVLVPVPVRRRTVEYTFPLSWKEVARLNRKVADDARRGV